MHAEKLSFKKTVVASERDRPDVARRRAQWIKYQGRIAPERLIFIDETWTKTNMAPLRGWARRGLRLTAKVPHGRWRTTTFRVGSHRLIQRAERGHEIRARRSHPDRLEGFSVQLNCRAYGT